MKNLRLPRLVFAALTVDRVSRVEALRARHRERYMVAMNEGHSIDHKEVRIEFLTRVARFLGDEMKIAK